MAVASNLSATTLMAAGNSTEDTKVMPPDPIQQLMRHADFRTTEKHYPVRHHPGGCRPDPRNTVDCDSKCAPEQDTDRRKFVRPAGFEPATLGSEERRSSADRVRIGFSYGKQPHRLAADGAQIAV